MSRRWVSVRDLLEGPVSAVAPSQPATPVDPGAKAGVGAPSASSIKLARSEPGKTPPPPGKHAEYEHDEPSLAAKARPDLGGPQERHKSFREGYEDKEHKADRLRHIRGSSSHAFHKMMSNGHQSVVKPLEGAGGGRRALGLPDDGSFHEPDKWSSRHDAMYGVMSAMGAHHMVVPGMAGRVHGRDRLHSRIPDPSADDGDFDQLNFEGHTKAHTMGASYAGKDAHVTEFAGNSRPMHQLSPEELEGVDFEHRLHGIVSHVLFGNADGHEGNILIHDSGHPILIDHDLTLDSHHGKTHAKKFGKKTVRSQFAPGGLLDYRAKLPENMKTVGSNFPPRMMQTLKSIAEGTFKHGLSKGDADALRANAQELLSGGLEGALEGRHIHFEENDRRRS